MRWFRLFAEARTDNKLRSLTDAQHRVWFNLLCYASEQAPRGEIQTDDPFMLAVECANGDESLLLNALDALIRLRIVRVTGRDLFTDRVTGRDIDDGGVTGCDSACIVFLGWEERQYAKPSDRPAATAERKRKSRAAKPKTTPPTPPSEGVSRHVTPGHATDTDTDTDTERDSEASSESMGPGKRDPLVALIEKVRKGKVSKTKPPAYVPEFEVWWKAYPRHEPSKREAFWFWLRALARDPGVTHLDLLTGIDRWREAWEAAGDARLIPHATTWLNQGRWESDPAIPGAAPRYYAAEPEPAAAPAPPSPEELEARRRERGQRAAAAQAERERQAAARLEAAKSDPRRPPNVSPEKWAAVPDDMQERYAQEYGTAAMAGF